MDFTLEAVLFINQHLCVCLVFFTVKKLNEKLDIYPLSTEVRNDFFYSEKVSTGYENSVIFKQSELDIVLRLFFLTYFLYKQVVFGSDFGSLNVFSDYSLLSLSLYELVCD